ncbi:unnamed protein product [Auanema sp. JU1783]|nr:unnamed protein product [Auanema sp. JU1783]
MYKAGHSAVSRTVLPSIQHKRRTVYTSPIQNQTCMKTEDRLLLANVPANETVFPDIQMSMFPKKNRNNINTLTPPSTPSSPSSPLLEQQIEFLHNSWRAFRETSAGELDPKIVTYSVRDVNTVPADFQPFNIDRFLAEKLLQELDIDPKIALF